MLRLVNIALCGVCSRRYDELSRKYRFVMQLIELYAPYSLFKGWYVHNLKSYQYVTFYR